LAAASLGGRDSHSSRHPAPNSEVKIREVPDAVSGTRVHYRGILIVQFANARQAAGLSKMDALRDAALTRLRPVLMTSAAMVLGQLPLVLVSGPGAAARNSIGIILVAGMIVGTTFTLFVVPVFYSLLASEHRLAGNQIASLPPLTPAT